MFLLVLRLLAVYFGTAAAGLWLAHRFVTPVRFRVAILLALGPFLLVGKALVTAGVHAPVDIAYQAPPLSTLAAATGTQVTQTRIPSDVAFQEIPWCKAVREAGSAISAATLLFGLLVLRPPSVALPAARTEWPAPVDIADRVAVESSENRRAVGASAGSHAVPASTAQRSGGAMAKRELD